MNAQELAEVEDLLKSSSDEEVLEVTAKEMEECSICFEEMWKMKRAKARPCGHIFHKVCLERWVNHQDYTCPICRADIYYVQSYGT